MEIHPFSTKKTHAYLGLYQVQGHKQEVAKMFSYIKIMVAHSNLLHHGSSSSEPSDVVNFATRKVPFFSHKFPHGNLNMRTQQQKTSFVSSRGPETVDQPSYFFRGFILDGALKKLVQNKKPPTSHP